MSIRPIPMDPRVAHELIAIALTVAQRIGGGGASRPKRARRKLADGGASGDAPTPDAYLDAFEHLNAPTSADAIRRGVPRPESDTLLKYGGIDLVPAFHRWPEAALTGLENLSGAALAFPPTAAAAGPVEYSIGTLLQAPRAAFGALSRSSADIAPALPRSGPVVDDALTLARKYTSGAGENLAALRSEVDDLAARGKSFGVSRDPLPDVELSPTEELNVLAFMRDSLTSKIAARQDALDRANAVASRGSVPSVDGVTPIRERDAVLDALQANPYVQPIKGRAGFPTKQTQIDLARQYFDNAGRLNPPGPWGLDMNAEVQRILGEAARRQDLIGPSGPAANLPGVPSIVEGYKNAASDAAAARREADQLRSFLEFRERQLRNLRNKPSGSSGNGSP